MHALAVLSVLLATHIVTPQPRDSALARRLRLDALDQEVALNLDSALVLLRAARRADPAYFPAQHDYIFLRQTRYEQAALRREAVSLSRSTDPGDRCLGIAIAGLTEERDTFQELLSLERSGGATTCSTFYLATGPPRGDYPDSLRLSFYARALRETPEMMDLWAMYAEFVKTSGNLAEGERILERGRQAVQHPLYRLQLAAGEINVRVARGDTAGALALKRSIRVALDRDGRPGLRAWYESSSCTRRVFGEIGEDQNAQQQTVMERTRVRGDWAWEERALISCGHQLLDRGEPLQALRYLSRGVAIADSVRLPDLYLELYIQRGRAYTKLGRHADAERELKRALTLGAGAGRLYNVADAYQQLSGMYEGAGRWAEANRAVEHFIALTRNMEGALHLSSLLDAGEIRWKAGWHASAREAFDEMVRVSDRLGLERYWAGAYYERIGDLERARQYYAKANTELASNSRAQSGLARVYEKLGQLDSAEAVARVHDAQEALWPPLEVPLMPAILARRGRTAEAIRIARAWAVRQEQRGNAEGASLAFLELSRVALDAHATSVALVSAEHAEGLAKVVHLTTERVQSATLRGRALQQLGTSDSALSVLRGAALSAKDNKATDDVFEAHLALGDAFAGRGQPDSALVAYEVAARAAERVTGSLAEDLDRARYRDRHLLPFDGAVKVLVRGELGARRVGQLVAWSARRKAAALALAVRDAPDRATASRNRVSLGDITSRLAEGDALLDYVVLDSIVAVISITRERTSVTRLPVSTDSLRAMVERLRHPLVTVYAGRLDLARAPFDLGTAAQLHSVLVRPLASLLAGKRRLLIVPDGPLHALSFEALVVTTPANRAGAPDYAGASYLMDAYEVEYLPSASFLAQPEPRRTASLAGSRLLVVAYGAPGADQEASALQAAWPAGRSTLLTGAAATEHAVKAAMSRFDMIHFVVHAQASARDPLVSHLRLAPDSIEDGYLHLDEIAAAKLGARLVVLSACETDAGPIYNGEGVMGLARAFLASGAHAVVGTQWPVGPTTAELMKQFYRRLANGEAPSPALRAAKLAMRSAHATAHPFYWAGTVLVVGGAGR